MFPLLRYFKTRYQLYIISLSYSFKFSLTGFAILLIMNGESADDQIFLTKLRKREPIQYGHILSKFIYGGIACACIVQ